MRRALLAATWLACCLAAASSQSLSFPQGLQAYRFNPILVQGIASHAENQILVTGALFDGREVALFTGAGTPAPGGALRCLAYVDEEIAALYVRIRRAAGNTLETLIRRLTSLIGDTRDSPSTIIFAYPLSQQKEDRV